MGVIKNTKVGQWLQFLPRKLNDLVKRWQVLLKELTEQGGNEVRNMVAAVIEELLRHNGISLDRYTTIKEDNNIVWTFVNVILLKYIMKHDVSRFDNHGVIVDDVIPLLLFSYIKFPLPANWQLDFEYIKNFDDITALLMTPPLPPHFHSGPSFL